MSLNMQIGGIQLFFEDQRWQSIAENIARGWVIVWFNSFWVHSSRLLSSSSSIFFWFLVCFEWFKIWWVRQSRLYNNLYYSTGKDAMVKDFKLKILICFKSLIIEHWTPSQQKPISSPFLYQIKQFWWCWKCYMKC